MTAEDEVDRLAELVRRQEVIIRAADDMAAENEADTRRLARENEALREALGDLLATLDHPHPYHVGAAADHARNLLDGAT